MRNEGKKTSPSKSEEACLGEAPPPLCLLSTWVIMTLNHVAVGRETKIAARRFCLSIALAAGVILREAFKPSLVGASPPLVGERVLGDHSGEGNCESKKKCETMRRQFLPQDT